MVQGIDDEEPSKGVSGNMEPSSSKRTKLPGKKLKSVYNSTSSADTKEDLVAQPLYDRSINKEKNKAILEQQQRWRQLGEYNTISLGLYPPPLGFFLSRCDPLLPYMYGSWSP